jgi:hypothetical protein
MNSTIIENVMYKNVVEFNMWRKMIFPLRVIESWTFDRIYTEIQMIEDLIPFLDRFKNKYEKKWMKVNTKLVNMIGKCECECEYEHYYQCKLENQLYLTTVNISDAERISELFRSYLFLLYVMGNKSSS